MTWRNRPLSAEYQERTLPSDLRPSRPTLTIVCGPPGAGKNTYVSQNASPEDPVIDLDAILQKVTGLPLHHRNGTGLNEALDERNRQLRALADDAEHDRAWFIVCAARASERAIWKQRLGGELILLEPPLDECLRRIDGDPARAGQRERMKAAAAEWWRLNPTADELRQRLDAIMGTSGPLRI